MLVLTRKIGETILIGGEIEVTVVQLSGNSVRLGVEAPQDAAIVRSELKGRSEAVRRGERENVRT